MTSPIEVEILRLLQDCERGSVAPEAVARAVASEDWRRVLPEVRATAKTLAREGRLLILRHGKPVDPDNFKGVYRLGAPGGG